MATCFRSKTDAWLLALLIPAMAASLGAAFVVVELGSPAAWLLALAIAVTGTGLPLWLLLATHYTLDSQRLVVRSGPFTWRIEVADITGISPSRSPISSPALSLDRLRIDYGHGRLLLISPRDRQGFLHAIETARRLAD